MSVQQDFQMCGMVCVYVSYLGLGPYLDLFFCCLHLDNASECLSYPKPLTCRKLCGKYIA